MNFDPKFRLPFFDKTIEILSPIQNVVNSRQFSKISAPTSFSTDFRKLKTHVLVKISVFHCLTASARRAVIFTVFMTKKQKKYLFFSNAYNSVLIAPINFILTLGFLTLHKECRKKKISQIGPRWAKSLLLILSW